MTNNSTPTTNDLVNTLDFTAQVLRVGVLQGWLDPEDKSIRYMNPFYKNQTLRPITTREVLDTAEDVLKRAKDNLPHSTEKNLITVPSGYVVVPAESVDYVLVKASVYACGLKDNDFRKAEIAKHVEVLMLGTNNNAKEIHPDDLAVDAFAALMKQKMAVARDKGRSGWENKSQCDSNTFAKLIASHLHKDNEGNLIDLANLLMMFAHHSGNASQILNYLQFPDKEMATFEHHGVTFDTNQPYLWVTSIQADFIENFNGQLENQGVFFNFKGKYQPFGDKTVITQLNFSIDDVLISADIAIEMTVAVANALSKLKSHRTDLLEFKDQQIARMHADIDIADKKYRIAGESEFYDSPEELLAQNDLEPIGRTEIECFAMLERPSLYAYVKQDGEGDWENVLITEDEEDA